MVCAGGTDGLVLIEELLRLQREPFEALAGPPPPAALPYRRLESTDGDRAGVAQ